MIKNKSFVMGGAEVGEHGFHFETLLDEINERVISRGCTYVNLNTSRVKWDECDFDTFIAACKLLADNKVYFTICRHAQKAPQGKATGLGADSVARIKEAAGEYFLGDCITEPGLAYSAKGEKFFSENYSPNFEFDNVKDAHDKYISIVKDFCDRNRSVGIDKLCTIESTMLTKYNIEAGIPHHILETPNGDADMLIPSVRGAVNALDTDKRWDVLIAHEWYGGMRHQDILKRKRLDLVTKFCYLSGTSGLALESGDDFVSSYGQKFAPDDILSVEYRKALADMIAIARDGGRPDNQPKVTFGIISGLYDGYAGFSNSSVWAQYGRAEWGHGEAEYSYRLLENLANKRRWCDVINYGEQDTSSLPAYGTYDIIPIEADVDALSKYEYLVFLGWNTMTDENMDKLTEYVRRGGKLLLSGAHLNYSIKREGEYIPPSNEKLEALCGCRYTGEDLSTNCGTKFIYETLNEKHRYPASVSLGCDPLFSAGYTSYMKMELTSANELGHAEKSWSKGDNLISTVLENKIGKGTVTLVTSKNYPGHPALTPLYSMLFREFVASSARECEIKVIASDKLRYSVYEGNVMYLLNTDFDLPITVKIIYNGEERLINLDSLELKRIQL